MTDVVVVLTEAERRQHQSAREAVQAAIARGEIEPRVCEICTYPKADAHHDDYSRPMEVRWLCPQHHAIEHGKGGMNPMIGPPLAPFTLDEAKRETVAIKRVLGKMSSGIEAVKARLIEAEQREVWRILGYRSMAGYVGGALGMSRSNAYRTLDQARATLLLDVPRGTPPPSQRQAERMLAPLKKRPKRGIPDKTSVINAVSTAIDNFENASYGLELEDIMAFMSHDERRALERAVGKAGMFAETWGDLLTRPIERRYIEESA